MAGNQPSARDVSKMAFEAALDQPQSDATSQVGFDSAAGQYVTDVASRAREIKGVQHAVAQTPGVSPVTGTRWA